MRVGAGHEARERVLVTRELPGEHEDAVVVVAEAELALGADHAGRDVAVGLARADRERPLRRGEHAAGEDDHDEVAGVEVVGAADDALGLTGAVGVADVDGAPVDRLAVLLRLGVAGEHAADDEGAGDTTGVQALLLEADARRGRRRSASPVASCGTATYSRSQSTGTRIRSPSRTVRRSARRPRSCPACR